MWDKHGRKIHPILEPGLYFTEQGLWQVTPEMIREIAANSAEEVPFGPHHWPKGFAPPNNGGADHLTVDGDTLLAYLAPDAAMKEAIDSGYFTYVSGEFTRDPAKGWKLDRIAALDPRIPPAYKNQPRLDASSGQTWDILPLIDGEGGAAIAARSFYSLATGVAVNLAVEDKDKFIFVRVRAPENYSEYRTKALSAKEGILAVFGKSKAGEWEIQALRFEKAKSWTAAKAVAWRKDHADLSEQTLSDADPTIDDGKNPPKGGARMELTKEELEHQLADAAAKAKAEAEAAAKDKIDAAEKEKADAIAKLAEQETEAATTIIAERLSGRVPADLIPMVAEAIQASDGSKKEYKMSDGKGKEVKLSASEVITRAFEALPQLVIPGRIAARAAGPDQRMSQGTGAAPAGVDPDGHARYVKVTAFMAEANIADYTKAREILKQRGDL